MTIRRVGLLAVVLVVGAGCLFAGSLLLLAGILGSSTDEPTGCGSPQPDTVAAATGGKSVGDLTAAQLANADAVIAEGHRLGVPAQGIVIALATASQESGFVNYANDGRGPDVSFIQYGIHRSLSLPHEAVGSDHGSLGIFQQQWPWWGSMRDLMNPAKAADKFYRSLLSVPGWQSMPVTVAAQKVQRSAYPSAYADDEPLARQLLGQLGDAPAPDTGSGQPAAYTSSCATTVQSGPVVYPLPRSAHYVDLRNWGGRGGHWSSWHTGTDLSVACSTPVLAATAGTVIVRTDQPWAGRWLVQVSTGVGQLTTWYAHMRALDVKPGQQVTAGEQIGEVGDLGNATGCHLHFEVHPQGGSIYRDSVNPTTWLQQHVGQSPGPSVEAARWGEGGFTIATFNVLGASHTAPGGKEPRLASGPARMRGTVALFDKYGVDVAGLQELQAVQYRALVSLAGDRYAMFHARGDTENSLLWRRDRFQLVSAGTVDTPYFDGHNRRMPVVELRDRLSGSTATFVNVHNPADTRQYPDQAHWRALAVSRERAMLTRRTRRGPVFLTGDMNDRQSVFCRLAVQGPMTSASGKTAGGGCQPPAHAQIDWIFGSRGTEFSNYTVDRHPLREGTSDHPFVVARAVSNG